MLPTLGRLLTPCAAVAVLISLTSQPAAAQWVSNDRFARMYLGALREGDTVFAFNLLDSTGLATDPASTFPRLAQMRDSLRLFGPPDSAQLVQQVLRGAVGGPYHALSYRIGHDDHWSLAQVDVVNRDGRLFVAGIHWSRVGAIPADQYDFTWRSGSVAGYLAMATTVIVAVFALYTAVTAYRTPMARRRWWAIASLVGTSSVTVAWIGGMFEPRLLHLMFPPVGFARAGPGGPWLIQFAVPIGALLAWQRIRAHRRVARASEAPSPAQDAAPAS